MCLALEVFWARPNGKSPPGRPRAHLMDYVSHLAREHHGIPQEELESVPGQTEAWRALLSLLPLQPILDKRMIMAGWMDWSSSITPQWSLVTHHWKCVDASVENLHAPAFLFLEEGQTISFNPYALSVLYMLKELYDTVLCVLSFGVVWNIGHHLCIRPVITLKFDGFFLPCASPVYQVSRKSGHQIFHNPPDKQSNTNWTENITPFSWGHNNNSFTIYRWLSIHLFLMHAFNLHIKPRGNVQKCSKILANVFKLGGGYQI